MKKGLIITAILGIFLLSHCTKDESSEAVKKVRSIDEIVVPQGFTWENSRDVYFDINIADTLNKEALRMVSIYDADPSLGGNLLSKGSASASTHFTTKVYIPNTVKEVFIVRTAPDNSTSTQKVEVTGPKISLSMFTAVKDKVAIGDKVAGLEDSPNCSSGCTQTITSSNTNLNVNNGDVVCVTGSNITIGFNANGGTIRICGTNITVQNASLNNSATLIVTSSGSANFSNLNINGSSSTFKNYGTVTVNGSFSPGGNFTNEATLTTTGDFDMNGQSTLVNAGVINVGASMNVNTTNVSTNNGSIITATDFQLNSSSQFVNNCSLWVKGNYTNNGGMKNYNLIKVNNTTTINSRTEVGLYAGAQLKTTALTLNGTVKGYGSTSLVKVSGTTIINSSGTVNGALQYCDANGIETNNGTISGGAVQACSVYIPVTNCNSEGNGTPPIVDTDGDGVNDTLDEYPNDATKAYNNYYPSSSDATVAFEDKWPLKGDYDLNDVVISYRYKIVTNAQNKVVQVNGTYALQATGGDFNNGFGIEFPILRSAVSGTTGGTLETGQTNAVVILFSNMHTELSHWNTKAADPVAAPKNYSVTFNISNGPSLSTFGLSPYNPFIWDNGNTNNGRGREIHLPGKTPTSLANVSLFGTGDDHSSVSAARYYVTTTGLPWAITMPVKPFKYPFEQTSIILGYLKFQAWAESGGVQFPDWYSTLGSAYRDESKLYQ